MSDTASHSISAEPNLQPHKLLIKGDAVPPTALAAINYVIMREEGGWVVTSTPNDNDGGWTYGGMSNNAFKEYYTFTRTQIDAMLKDTVHTEWLQKQVVAVYYQEFYVPLLSHAQDTTNLVPEACHFSCAVNCGTGTAIGLIRAAASVTGNGVGGVRREFLRLWARHYADICIGNPSKLEFLHGWLNRVFSYVAAA